MLRYRDYTKWAETADYLVEQINSKTKSLQEKTPVEVPVSFSPAFLIASIGVWR